MIGVQATSLGAASLAIGLALHGTLSNVTAGVILLIFRPFRLGNSIKVALAHLPKADRDAPSLPRHCNELVGSRGILHLTA
jgi:hypothetical protein